LIQTGSRVIEDQFRPALVPYPKSLHLLDSSQGAFVLSRDTKLNLGSGVQGNAPYILAATEALTKRINEATNSLSQGSSVKASTILLDVKQQSGKSPEGYKITVQNNEVKLEGYGPEGLSHGVNTLQQLMPLSINVQSTLRSSDASSAALMQISASDMTDAGIILPMEIEDSPAFTWRGFHLDVSRHFFPAEDVKKLLDTMAAYKLNRFHWHLTDDQGWRFPVPGYPKLVGIGAGPRYKGDAVMSSGEGIEGFYTKEEIQDVLEYAKARHIQVIPEVDVPGHTAAAIAAYPELGNPDFDAPKGPQHEFGVHQWTLAPTKKSAEFLEAVFAEVASLFPDSEYIHIGGDEAPQDQWLKSSAEAKQNWEQFEGTNAQSYFNNKVSDIVHKHGKKLAGWDEVQSVKGLPKDAAIFAWRGENELQKAVRAGRPVINADSGHLYLDHYQGPEGSEPKAIGGPLTTARDVYQYNPVPASVPEQDRHLILGGQAQLWSEYFPTWKQVEYMAFPRGIALAERLWTPQEELSYPDFSKRLQIRLHDLKHWGVNFKEFEF
jgi:hexosaminidase